jgi:hypothetical protein
MIKRIVLSVILVLPHVVLASQGTLAKALPQDGEVEGWTKHRSRQHFAGENLYEYINGGAEIYHEYGFVQVVVQDYVNGTGKSISVEIFEMASPASAYGMYTFKTNSKGERISVGKDAQLADYYMNFWMGSHLVTLTGFDETEETRTGLRNMAKNISSKLPAGGDKPRMVSFLPEEGLVAQSPKYFTGFLGLRNSHPFFSWNIAGFEQGVKGDYIEGFSFFLIRFAGEQESRIGFQSMKAQKDRRGRRLFVATHRQYLMFVIGNADRIRAEQVFDRARNRIHE